MLIRLIANELRAGHVTRQASPSVITNYKRTCRHLKRRGRKKNVLFENTNNFNYSQLQRLADSRWKHDSRQAAETGQIFSHFYK